MLVLGLTGSVAMGKSTTARFFAEEGVPVHDADAVVHHLYEGDAVPIIEAAFPGTTAGGKVDRVKLGSRVMNDLAALRQLEAIVHPLVQDAEQRFLAEAQAKGAPVAVLNVPLLFETGGDRRVDAVVVATAPAEVQRARALERPRKNSTPCWPGSSRTPRSGGAPISWWIRRGDSTMRARRCRRSCEALLQCRNGDADSGDGFGNARDRA
jgi:dephospho-CoA kinase